MKTIFELICTITILAPITAFNIHRPSSSTWSRTKCGSPAGSADIPTKWAQNVNPAKWETPLNKYPRPQMVRLTNNTNTNHDSLRDEGDDTTWTNLNGLWQWEPTTAQGLLSPPFQKELNRSILVPFPVESCLSGAPQAQSSDQIVQHMFYRLLFDQNKDFSSSTILHFGAVDWQSSVFLNGVLLGNNTGGYNGFSFDITEHLKPSKNELIVYVFDPSDSGDQPNGKQRLSATNSPGGDTYTPSSGIWQTVWMWVR